MFRCQDDQLCLSRDMSDDFDSGIWDINGVTLGSIEVAWAGFTNAGATATIKCQVSNSGINWCDVPSSSCDVTGTTGDQFFVVPESYFGFRKLKLVYSAGGASAGTLTAVATAKVLMDNGISGGPA